MYVNSIQFSVLNGIESALFNISEDLDFLEKHFFFENIFSGGS